ncbi:50S ribosomal protein L16 [Patescibacteria group bacterium]
MLQPKKMKYRKHFRGKMKGKAQVGCKISFGDYGLKALSRGWVSNRQIEAARKTITHETKRIGKLWIRIFPDKTYTKKGAGVRMGGGKGDIEGYVAIVKPGRIIFEIAGVDEAMAREAFRKAAQKLSVKTRFAQRI